MPSPLALHLHTIRCLQPIVHALLTELETTPPADDTVFNEKMKHIETLQNEIASHQRAAYEIMQAQRANEKHRDE